MKLGGWQKLTLLDYPGRLASLIFIAGCNLRCKYCHNHHLFDQEPDIDSSEVLDYLRLRAGKLTGVVISGGEPLANQETLALMASIKELGYLIKLDTNGTFPERLFVAIRQGLVDYLALDVKADSDHYLSLTGVDVYRRVIESLSLVRESGIDYEVRLTVTNEYLDEQQVCRLSGDLAGVPRCFLQPYRPVANRELSTPSRETLLAYREILGRTIDEVIIRGLD